MLQQSKYLTDMPQDLSPKKLSKAGLLWQEQYHGVDTQYWSSTSKNIIYDVFYIFLYVLQKWIPEWMMYKGINAF